MSIKNFILVGTQRTGSSALAELIGLHPDIICGWEWSQHMPRSMKIVAAEKALTGDFSWLPVKEQAHMHQVFNPDVAWLGYRRLFRSSDKWLMHPRFAPALWVDRLEDHLEWLKTRPDIHIIHVRRDDHIAWLKSKFFSRKAGSYVAKAYPKEMEVRIPLGEAIARIKSKIWVDKRLMTLKESNPYLQVWYEDFSIDKISVVHSVYQFLGCKKGAAKLSMEIGRKRQSSGPIPKGVMNYSELFAKLQYKNLLRAGRITKDDL